MNGNLLVCEADQQRPALLWARLGEEARVVLEAGFDGNWPDGFDHIQELGEVEVGDKVTILDGDAIDREATASLMAEQAELADYTTAHEETKLPWTPEQLETRFNWRG